MQTILGAGGSIANDLAKELLAYTDKIRLVSRNPKKVNDSDEVVSADLMDGAQVEDAVKGSSVAYLVAGLPYTLKAWKSMWPQIMQNSIDACKKHKVKLVFFDNIYLYSGLDLSPILETAKVNPPSQKGRIRARIIDMLEEEIQAGGLQALVARAPDFYGPGIKNGLLNEAVLKPMKAGKKANWFCSVNKIHSFIWTPDAAKATAILGNDDSAYGQTWHLPTSKELITGKEMIERVALELGVKPSYQVAGHILVRLLGLFDPLMREFVEMLYQYDRDYLFDSSKFENKYPFKITSYSEGIKKMVAASD